MIKTMLTAASIPSQEARFPDPPDLHAVYFDSVTTDGPDADASRIFTHEGTVELYVPTIAAGNIARGRFLAELDAKGIHYSTQGWYWLSDIRRYQEIIEFTFIEKI